MPRILVCNNYPLDRVWQEVRLGETPDQGLFGVNYFHRHGYETNIMPCEENGFWTGVKRLLLKARFSIPLGDLSQQRSVLNQLNAADLIYAPCGEQTHLLHYLKAMGLLTVPIVCLIHHPFLKGTLNLIREPFYRMFVAGADVLPTLSKAVAKDLQTRFDAGEKTFHLTWGPDLAFYPKSQESGHGVVTAGRTGRDFVTLGRAASLTTSPTTIVCLDGRLDMASGQFADNVKVLLQPDEQPVPGKKAGWMKYGELLELFLKARVIAIPLVAQESLAGLTSLMDALGIGKPVIMTRNRHIDLDIEAEGIGLWVDPGDVIGWKHAIEWFEQHEEDALEMGHKARRLAEERMNSELFAGKLMDIFDRILGGAGDDKTSRQELQSNSFGAPSRYHHSKSA